MPEPILTGHLFAPLHEELMALLRGLSADEWNAPTVAGAWTVRDVAAHLLDTALRRLAMHRDRYAPPASLDKGLAAFVNDINASGVAFARRLSPELLIDLHERYGRELAEFLASLDPFADAMWGVSWAGDDRSPMWFDVARELTERWHHQQQIRDAVERGLLDRYLAPVIDTFVRALPFTYRDVAADDGTAIVLRIDDAAWTLVHESSWRLYVDAIEAPTTTVTMSPDKAWRVFTRQKIDPHARIEGGARYAEPLLKMVTVI
ncbi:MAG TPA: maleylpyruvate isomerase N-terminal domain-containing protein [Thermoanaerobaculia bacterium]|nr:maleylpyruvate isomerase N-terminal domain-containing protein [Thermoanaerobaculia bacterium]